MLPSYSVLERVKLHMYSKNILSDRDFLYGMSEVPKPSPQASSGFRENKSSFFDSRKSAKFNCK